MAKTTVLLPGNRIIIDDANTRRLKERYGGEEVVSVIFGYIKDDDYSFDLPLSEYMRRSIAEGLIEGKYELHHNPYTQTHTVYNKETGDDIPRIAGNVY